MDALTQPRTLIPLIGLTIGFIAGLINGDDESWLKLFFLFAVALVVAIWVFEARPTPTGPDAQPPHPSKLAAGLGTGAVLIGALILLLLKYTRPLFFASTEAAFSLAVIDFLIPQPRRRRREVGDAGARRLRRRRRHRPGQDRGRRLGPARGQARQARPTRQGVSYRVHSPERPPRLASSMIGPITMPRSTALAMS